MTYRIPAPGDQLTGIAGLRNAHLTDFWRWAFSDLCEDYLKGIFAEWMVAVLLGLPLEEKRRLEFGNCDLELPNGLRLEVKATAAWQSWKLIDQKGEFRSTPKKPATPANLARFGGLLARAADSDTGDRRVYKADVYVFCFHYETDLSRWDAMDLTQWEFYVVRREELEKLGVRSISLRRVRQLCPKMTAEEFRRRMEMECTRGAV